MENLVIVFVAGLITALATGIGALPFFFIDDLSEQWNVGLWGIASGIMVTVSVLGLIAEGLGYVAGGFPTMMVAGLLAGVILVELGDRVLDHIDFRKYTGNGHGHEFDYEHAHDVPDDSNITETVQADGAGHTHDDHALETRAIASGNPKTLLLVLGILTIHSFPEGVAIGVSFAKLGMDTGLLVLGATIPVLAVFMTIAISIHNIPEGTAIAIPMREMGLSKWKMVGAAIFSSLPQPIGAVVAFVFVSWAQSFLPFGFGFAAGAMVYLVITEFIPEALETGRTLPNNGYRELAVGFATGCVAMLPLLII